MTAKFRSHVFCCNLHECRIEIPCVFEANIPVTHTAYAGFFIGVAGIVLAITPTGQPSA